MARQLARKIPLGELHCHLGGAVTPAIMWGIAHAQGIKLPTKDYWAFRDMITVSRHTQSFDGYLQLFHWTELSELTDRDRRSVHGRQRGLSAKQRHDRGAALPDESGRGGEQDRPHHLGRRPDGPRDSMPIKPGLIFAGRAFPAGSSGSSPEKAVIWRPRRRPGSTSPGRKPRPSGSPTIGRCSGEPASTAWA
jgi:adenosine deaminase